MREIFIQENKNTRIIFDNERQIQQELRLAHHQMMKISEIRKRIGIDLTFPASEVKFLIECLEEQTRRMICEEEKFKSIDEAILKFVKETGYDFEQ